MPSPRRTVATAACTALIDYGQAALGVTAVYAGVTKANVKSEAVLRRLGFQAVADRGPYTLWRSSPDPRSRNRP
jgi:RimJ/RimL family protein N-acetyltransferase